MNTPKPAAKAPISKDRAVILKEVLKKFQNSENQE